MKNLLISENTYALIRQTGLALAHSLWIGAVAALLAAAVIMLTRRSRPELRYNLLTGLLLLFIVATGIAFVQSGPEVRAGAPVGVILAENIVNQPNALLTSSQLAAHQQSAIAIATDFLTQNIYWITLAWLVIVMVKISGLALGLYHLYQLKTQQLYSIGSHWEQRVAEFAKTMGISQPVKVFQSGLVKVPTVLGHFKPVILVPLGVITSIPADQIEMVLLHELAHIRRFDFVVNFLQRLTELLFFFNPGILWISKLIREERENCCDDMALRHSGNQTVYIRALLSFREYQLNENVYQLAFSGKGGLVQRAKRIASRTNPTLGAAEKTVLLITMLAFFTFSIVFAQSGGRQTDGPHTASPQRKNAKQSSNAKTSASTPAKRSNAQSLPNKANENDTKYFDNQHINNLNTDNKRRAEYSPQRVNYYNPASSDTLQPLHKPLTPRYQSLAPIYVDSSRRARLEPVAHRAYASTYQLQPLQTYQQEYRPSDIRIERQAINEKIMDAIEKQGVAISRNEIDFRITNKELILNGKKQPEGVHKAVLDAVLTSPDDVIDFTYGSHQ
ncbi:Signal transducer regulating beta-lactamase production, contains metallopeptidase domain [Dyadobacter soli]|uniref:Signal transducer regulating beta-lactamase production, contains metallopeptidase domain n=1 Tax=Dyadobacter soli TaxID=659014 RepID=A0A1G7GDG7_9BACT|nr:M56 family metallopeptidase [Dyadobacter soli]SDE86049.1 Signal transducer regulating beta-lactamase production, contains metallopeptidase domain [Dyadobacter soli]